ncbi:Cytochrome c oxidase (B(O/a)3-type) chain II [hydrothermal vent metagenome]|uniref:Cytochrome c oxidase (B(O/a)3-type) chain II n=1 Tax=hydrothermal vent metagenome TaxID=652676 RepID=A0A3B0RYI9_9ZZZZ
MQETILFLAFAGMAMVAGWFIQGIRASTTNVQTQPINEGRRSVLFWGLLVGGILITTATLWRWPHDASAGEGSVSVNVTGSQWSWEIDRETLPAGKTVVFNVHTTDVNHGMGITDDTGRILVQTQAMPGYVNQVRYVFEKPGTYNVICLEFCGIGHADMINEFKVVAEAG